MIGERVQAGSRDHDRAGDGGDGRPLPELNERVRPRDDREGDERHEDGKTLIGFAGRFVEEKGFDYLLRALPALADAVPDAQLVYAGEHRIATRTSTKGAGRWSRRQAID